MDASSGLAWAWEAKTAANRVLIRRRRITSAGIIEPLLLALGMNTEGSRLLVLMAMGAGSMTVSHANDAYFWVISKFGELDTNTTLKAYSTATFIMGIVAFLSVYVASLIIV